MAVIDAHQHFWRYEPEEYQWIDDGMRVIRRDFLPDELAAEIANAGIDGVVAVQARESVEESKWLLDLADAAPFVSGVVGWVPLSAAGVGDVLASLASRPRLKAVRHVLQGEPDPEYMLREDFNRGVALLREFGLAYDILIHERQLPNTIRFVDRHPDQTFVLDHIAKPRIREGVISPWRENLTELARRPNVYCKLSGMVTEADYRAWSARDLDPYIDTVLEAFGPRRLMFGTDWPVCLVAVTYRGWVDLVRRKVAGLSEFEQERILGGTAIEAYRL